MDLIRNFWWVAILLVIMLVVFEKFVLSPLLAKGLGKMSEGRKTRCRKCGGDMTLISSSLYSLPVYFDQLHEKSAEYYRKNAKAITGMKQVPTGGRVCKMIVFRCSSCGYKEVEVIDFLPVRNQEAVQSKEVYPYSEFELFFNNLEYKRQ